MRGPLLSGPLGSTATMAVLARWLRDHAPVVVLGPPWLAATLAAELSVIALVEAEEGRAARRASRRAARLGRKMQVVLAGAGIPIVPGEARSILVEGAAAIDPAIGAAWIAELATRLQPGGLLVALDGVSEPTAEARAISRFMGAALLDLLQERPRDGVLVTVGVAPPASVTAARSVAG